MASSSGILIAKIEGDVERFLSDLGLEIDKQLVKGLVQAASHAEGELKQTISEMFSSTTGDLRQNPKATLLKTDGPVKRADAFLDLVYARIQDIGGTITPKNAKALSVPISEKAKRTVGLWPRHWPKGQLTLIDRSKKGRPPLLVEQRAKRWDIHYVLKKSVTIRGKGYTERARRKAEKVIAEIMGDHVGIAIKSTKMMVT